MACRRNGGRSQCGERQSPLGGWCRAFVAGAVCFLFALPAPAQVSPTPVPPVIHFDVFSIRQSAPGTPQGASFTYTPDGYHARGQGLWETLMVAYYPMNRHYWRSERVRDFPQNLSDEQYDIDAKVAESDLPVWRAQGRENPLLMLALQEALRERCHLALHMEVAEAKVQKLVVTKRARALQSTPAAEKAPVGTVKLSDDLSLVPGNGDLRFYNTTMKGLAAWLTHRWVVVDGTDLPGSYDFVLPRILPVQGSSATEPDDPVPFRISELGLGLKSGTAPMPTLVIEHLEKPAPN